MSDQKRTVSDKPSQDKLPPPSLIWQGEYKASLGSGVCRLVLCYEWTLPQGAKEWIALPKACFEAATTKDRMGNWIYKDEPKDSIPFEFFEAIVDRSLQLPS